MPEVGVTSPMIMAMVVVLPAPLPPSRPVIEPGRSAKEMPSTAVVALVALDQVFDGDGRLFGGGQDHTTSP